MSNLYGALMRASGAASALVLGCVMLLVCWDVLARNTGLRGFDWVFDATEFSLPIATLLAAPWLLWRREHIRLDLLAKLPPQVLSRIEQLSLGFCLAICLVVVWYSVAVIVDSRSASLMVVKSLTFPEWWLFLPVPFSFGLMAVECLRGLLRRSPAMPKDT